MAALNAASGSAGRLALRQSNMKVRPRQYAAARIFAAARGGSAAFQLS